MYEFKSIRCPLCGGERTKDLGVRDPLSFAGKSAQIVRCIECGLIYPNPFPYPSRSQLQINYGDVMSYFPDVESERVASCEKILQHFETITGRKGRLLDVGCGRGELVYTAQRSGWDAIGTDISEAFVRYAKERFRVTARAGNLDEMGFLDESFDVVSLVSVLQCCTSPMTVLREIHRILRRDGVLFIETTNYDGLIYTLGDYYYRLAGQKRTTRLSPLSPAYEVWGFSPQSLTRALTRTGYEVVKIRPGGNVSGGSGFRMYDLKTAILFLLRYGVLILGLAMGRGQVLNAWARKI